MAKYYGIIGYGTDDETAVDVWTTSITERPYFGDVIQTGHRWETGENINDNTRVTNKISIVADPFAYQDKVESYGYFHRIPENGSYIGGCVQCVAGADYAFVSC